MNRPSDFASLVEVLIDLLSLVIPLLFSLALLIIVWKVIQLWILSGGDTGKIEEGKQVALVGVIALVIMSGVWGILALLRASIFGI